MNPVVGRLETQLKHAKVDVFVSLVKGKPVIKSKNVGYWYDKRWNFAENDEQSKVTSCGTKILIDEWTLEERSRKKIKGNDGKSTICVIKKAIRINISIYNTARTLKR